QGNRSRNVEVGALREAIRQIVTAVVTGCRPDRFERALARALELFDLTARDDRWRGHRRRKILRAREEFCRLFFDEHPQPGGASTLRSYFLRFAVLARRRPS